MGHRTHTQRSLSLTKETGSAGQGGMTAVIQAFILAKVVGMGRYRLEDMGLYVVGRECKKIAVIFRFRNEFFDRVLL